MGLLDTIKGWFNIGGVKVKIQDLNTVIPRHGNHISAKVALTSKSDKTVLQVTYKFLMRRTTGRGDDQEIKEVILAEKLLPDSFDIKAGETKVLDLELDYILEESLKDKKSVMGGIGKLAAFATAEKDEYFIIAEADVKGTALDPSDEVQVTIK